MILKNWQLDGMMLDDVAGKGDQNQYKIEKHLGDGTFGRALKCLQTAGDVSKD